MGFVWIIIMLVCIGLLIAAVVGSISWKQALTYLAAVGLVALALALLLPRVL